MNKQAIYALDFDGVLCDSAIETGITGWKAAIQIWDDMLDALPAQDYVNQFKLARPIIETGYEAILVMRMLFTGTDIEAILTDFATKKQQLIDENQLHILDLKQLFGATRDDWIKNDLQDWVLMNPLFEQITEKLQTLSRHHTLYIVTTKQERFVEHILAANQISLNPENIFGLDRNKSKVEILTMLQETHSGQAMHFVEDRLDTLLNVIKHAELDAINLFFALWGYNTRQDKCDAKLERITAINLQDFLVDSNP